VPSPSIRMHPSHRRDRQRMITLIGLAAVIAVPLAACSSTGSGSANAPSSGPTSTAVPSATAGTLDPNAELNLIPYDVGSMTGLPGGWRIEVERVKRTASIAGLPAPGAGRDYVTVDVRAINDEGPNVRFDAAALFQLYDEGNNAHRALGVHGHPNALDGAFSPGTDRVGQLVFAAPAHSRLLMILDGQKLSSQRSVFQIDPPRATPRD
jgi:hypothetical protein